jgi:hypothetical protein
VGPFRHILQYIINEQHYFEILLLAEVENVQLDINKIALKF